MLTHEGCGKRQRRLLLAMQEQRIDLLVTGNYRTIYYLTGNLSAAEAPALLAIRQDGKSLLITGSKSPGLVDETIFVETYSIDRVIDEPIHDAVRAFRQSLSGWGEAMVCGLEQASTPALAEGAVRKRWPAARFVDAGSVIRRLRKRKEADEVEEIRASLRLITAAYDAGKVAIRAGAKAPETLTELDIYNEMQAAVVRAAGTFVQLHGDFATGTRAIGAGGPPTNRVIGRNDLYILDLFPAPALYFGDTCRTFAAGQPTDEQMQAWELVRDAVVLGERAIRPGVSARSVYRQIKDFLDDAPIAEKSFGHHAGHGIGHHGHEAPRIIPGSDDIFEVGDVITIEPGVYTTALHGGIRLEDNYLVREEGLENLFDYPRELL